MAAELQAAFPHAAVRLIPSGGGRFEVVSDGTPIFQKSKLGRHPAAGEVVDLIRTRQPETP